MTSLKDFQYTHTWSSGEKMAEEMMFCTPYISTGAVTSFRNYMTNSGKQMS